MSSKLRPASSVNLQYPSPPGGSAGRIECDMSVADTADQSYFCAIQFYPGGYCGLQQRDAATDKVAIFSVWNEGTNNVTLVKKGHGAEVETFGGEGTGLKCLKNFDWSIGTQYKFLVTCEKKDSNYEVSCYIDGDLMATYARSQNARPPILAVLSFVEDYNRWNNPHGCLKRRGMVIHRMAINGTSCQESAQFNCAGNDCEAYGKSFTGSRCDAMGCMHLWTGGQ